MADQSQAPKERINITFKPATGETKEEIELPLKLVVVGEFSDVDTDKPIEDRKSININKNNFNEVMDKQNLSTTFTVDDKLLDEDDASINVNLQINNMKDLSPERIIDQVPQLKSLADLRDALVALKGPLGNTPAFKNAIVNAMTNEEERNKLLKELNIGDSDTDDTAPTE